MPIKYQNSWHIRHISSSCMYFVTSEVDKSLLPESKSVFEQPEIKTKERKLVNPEN